MIYCIVGKSGTGKDTLYRQMMKHMSFSPIIPYTTRPKRVNEVEGETYNFVTDDEFRAFEAEGEIVEKRQYNTVHGVWTYFTRKFPMQPNTDYLYITTLEGAKGLVRSYGENAVTLIYLYLDDHARLQRCISRESRQTAPNYSEVCRRYLADEEDFTEAKLGEFKRIIRVDTGAANVTECEEIVRLMLEKNRR